MSDEEVELVARLLAKIGGTWYPDRIGSPPRPVSNRHREVAQLVVDTVDRLHATRHHNPDDDVPSGQSVEDDASRMIVEDQFHVGAVVEYRPPTDKRALTCRIEKIEGGRAYLIPASPEIGWVSTHTLLPLEQRRKSEATSRSFSATPNAPVDTYTEPFAIEAARLTPNIQTRIGDAPSEVLHYFNSFGDWIAFRRHPSDQYLFDRKGNWIGWFPWNDNDVIDLNGQYLGTVVDGDRFYRRTSSDATRREAGFVVHPGRSGYAGYPGHAAHRVPPLGFKDIDVTRIPTGRRFWLKSGSSIEAPSDGAGTFEVWMSKIGLGFLAKWIGRRSGRTERL